MTDSEQPGSRFLRLRSAFIGVDLRFAPHPVGRGSCRALTAAKKLGFTGASPYQVHAQRKPSPPPAADSPTAVSQRRVSLRVLVPDWAAIGRCRRPLALGLGGFLTPTLLQTFLEIDTGWRRVRLPSN